MNRVRERSRCLRLTELEMEVKLTVIWSQFSPPPASHVSAIFGLAPNRFRFEPCARGARSMPEAIASSNLRWYRLLKIYDLRTMAHDTKSNRNSVARKVTLSGTLANVDHKCRPRLTDRDCWTLRQDPHTVLMFPSGLVSQSTALPLLLSPWWLR